MTNQIKVVAFDCDGVLFDTTESNNTYYNHILKHFGKPPLTPEQFKYIHMHTADDSIAHLFSEKDQFTAAQAYRKELSYIPFIKFMEIEPSLKDVLIKLRPQYKTAIATNRTDTMDCVLEEFELTDSFDKVVTAFDVSKPKPDPEILMKIMEHFNVNIENMVYIGDSKLDEQAAYSAGIKFIAYRNPSLKADIHITSLSEILNIL